MENAPRQSSSIEKESPPSERFRGWGDLNGHLDAIAVKYLNTPKASKGGALNLLRIQLNELGNFANEYSLNTSGKGLCIQTGAQSAQASFRSVDWTLEKAPAISFSSEYDDTFAWLRTSSTDRKSFENKLSALRTILVDTFLKPWEITPAIKNILRADPSFSVYLPSEIYTVENLTALVSEIPEVFDYLPEEHKGSWLVPEGRRKESIAYWNVDFVTKNREFVTKYVDSLIAEKTPGEVYGELTKITQGALHADEWLSQTLEAAMRKHSGKYSIMRELDELPERFKWKPRKVLDLRSAIQFEQYGLGTDLSNLARFVTSGDLKKARGVYDHSFAGMLFLDKTIIANIGILDTLQQGQLDFIRTYSDSADKRSVLSAFSVRDNEELMKNFNGIPQKYLWKILETLPKMQSLMNNGGDYRTTFRELNVPDAFKYLFLAHIPSILDTFSGFQELGEKMGELKGDYALSVEKRTLSERMDRDIVSENGKNRWYMTYSVITQAFPREKYGADHIREKNEAFKRFLERNFDGQGTIRVSLADFKKELKSIFQWSENGIDKLIDESKTWKEILQMLIRSIEEEVQSTKQSLKDSWMSEERMEALSRMPKNEKSALRAALKGKKSTEEKIAHLIKTGKLDESTLPSDPQEREAIVRGIESILDKEERAAAMKTVLADPKMSDAYAKWWKGEISTSEMNVRIEERREELGIRGTEKEPTGKKSEGPDVSKTDFASDPKSFMSGAETGKTYLISDRFAVVRRAGGVDFLTPEGRSRFEGKTAEAAVAVASTLHRIGAEFLISAIPDIARSSGIVIRDGTLTGPEEAKLLGRISDVLGIGGFDRGESDVAAMRAQFARAASADGKSPSAWARQRGILTDSGSLSRDALARALGTEEAVAA